MTTRAITSADGKENVAPENEAVEPVSKTLKKDVREKKKVTNDNVEISNFALAIFSLTSLFETLYKFRVFISCG